MPRARKVSPQRGHASPCLRCTFSGIGAYHPALMAADAAALLDHLGIERADVMGYSMGARISAFEKGVKIDQASMQGSAQ